MNKLRISPTTLEYFRYLMVGKHEKIVQDGGFFKTFVNEEFVFDLNHIKKELIKPYQLNKFLICGALIDAYCDDGTTAVVKSDSTKSSWFAKFHEDHNFHNLNQIQLALGKYLADMQVAYSHTFKVGAYEVVMNGRVDALLYNGNVLDIKSTASPYKKSYFYHNSLQMAYYMYVQKCNVGLVCLVPYKLQELTPTNFSIIETDKPKVHYIERSKKDNFTYIVGWLTHMIDFLEQQGLIDHPKFALK